MTDYVKPATQGFALLGAAFLSGYIWCFSQAGVLTFRVAPAEVSVRQFKVMYNKGKSTSPLVVVAVTFCNALAAYQSSPDSSRLAGGFISSLSLYVVAAVSVPIIVPYTLLVMEPRVNRELIRMGTMAEKGMELDTD